ncbi:MAG TPA: 16S rRNA (cytidine(1402)-2'-O)-methyltransferase [Syntrophomonadaceae bacterium]|nr:16S rRNA (cytidine(1402)-2'-O)-methyltransferase [Syntrophomonadaceae bacterium]
MGELYLCATPLGNLEDITLRALRVLREADLIAAEDTRHTRKLLSHYGIHTPSTSFFEHNQVTKIPYLLEELGKGKTVALVTDAGLPGLADPGYPLVQAALAQGHRVTVVPGASAGVAALVISGFRPHPFYFHGFLPREKGERQELLKELREESRTGVFYEVPHRLQKSLQDFVEIWGGSRRVCIARELTKQFEEVLRCTFSEAAAHFSKNPPRGEFTLVTEGKREAEQAPPGDPRALREAVDALIRAGAEPTAAFKAVGRALGLSRSEVYRAYHLAAE